MVNRTRGFDEGVERQMRSPCTIEGALSLQHIVDRLDLGQHDVAQAVTGLTNDGSHVVGKGGMIHRMHTRRHPGARRSFAGQRSHQGCMLGLGTARQLVAGACGEPGWPQLLAAHDAARQEIADWWASIRPPQQEMKP